MHELKQAHGDTSATASSLSHHGRSMASLFLSRPSLHGPFHLFWTWTPVPIHSFTHSHFCHGPGIYGCSWINCKIWSTDTHMQSLLSILSWDHHMPLHDACSISLRVCEQVSDVREKPERGARECLARNARLAMARRICMDLASFVWKGTSSSCTFVGATKGTVEILGNLLICTVMCFNCVWIIQCMCMFFLRHCLGCDLWDCLHALNIISGTWVLLVTDQPKCNSSKQNTSIWVVNFGGQLAYFDILILESPRVTLIRKSPTIHFRYRYIHS